MYREATSGMIEERGNPKHVGLDETDKFNREAAAIEMDTSLPAQWVVRLVDQIAAWRGYPARIRCDSGPGFSGYCLAEWAERHDKDLL
jgi:putative transposase